MVQGSSVVSTPLGLPHSHKNCLQMDCCRSETRIVPSEGVIEVAFGYDDFLGGLEELKALPLKERRRYLKNKFFRVNNSTTLSKVI